MSQGPPDRPVLLVLDGRGQKKDLQDLTKARISDRTLPDYPSEQLAARRPGVSSAHGIGPFGRSEHNQIEGLEGEKALNPGEIERPSASEGPTP